MIQLRLPFPEWSPAAVALARQLAWHQHITERYPITPHEQRTVPPNVRLARFVPLAECEICAFACEDHRLSPLSVTLVCLKDHFKTLLPKPEPSPDSKQINPLSPTTKGQTMTEPKTDQPKPDCYICLHRGSNPGTAHIRCNHPSNEHTDSPAIAALAILVSAGRVPGFQIKTDLNVKGHPTGIARGWFNWPYMFDPTWLLECDGFDTQDAQ